MAETQRNEQGAEAAAETSRLLVGAFRAEMKNTRASARLGWALAAVLMIAGIVAAWWLARQAGSLEAQRNEVAGLTAKLTEAQGRLAATVARNDQLTAELATARADVGKALVESEAARAELTSAQEALASQHGVLAKAAAEGAMLKEQFKAALGRLERGKQTAEAKAKPEAPIVWKSVIVPEAVPEAETAGMPLVVPETAPAPDGGPPLPPNIVIIKGDTVLRGSLGGAAPKPTTAPTTQPE